MEKIKVQNVIGYETDMGIFYKPPFLYEKCFFDAGDFDFELDSYSSEIHYFSRENDEIFYSTMQSIKIYAWGSFEATVIERSAFDADLEECCCSLICFDPRIVMTHTLLALILESDEYDEDLCNEKDLTELLHPIPKMEEAKFFLRKNGILREEPIWGAIQPEKRRRINELLGVPDKVTEYIRSFKTKEND